MIYVRIHDPEGGVLWSGRCDGSLVIKNGTLYGDPQEVTLLVRDNSLATLERFTDLAKIENVRLVVQ